MQTAPTTHIVPTPTDFSLVIDDVLHRAQKTTTAAAVVALTGDLGAGKTTFTQMVGKHLRVQEQIVSPTFVVMKQYPLSHTAWDTLVHIDAYRIEDISETGPLRLQELFSQPRTLVFLEWPEKITAILPKEIVAVTITCSDTEERQVEVSG